MFNIHLHKQHIYIRVQHRGCQALVCQVLHPCLQLHHLWKLAAWSRIQCLLQRDGDRPIPQAESRHTLQQWCVMGKMVANREKGTLSLRIRVVTAGAVMGQGLMYLGKTAVLSRSVGSGGQVTSMSGIQSARMTLVGREGNMLHTTGWAEDTPGMGGGERREEGEAEVADEGTPNALQGMAPSLKQIAAL